MKTAVYERQVYYYETDRMDCVHHSNYIRWFEEARVHLMEVCGFSFCELEASGIVSPVLQVRAEYKSMSRFGETVLVETRVERYTGTRIDFSYAVRDKGTGALRCLGASSHCFLNEEGRPVALRKANPDYHARVLAALKEEEDKAF